MHDARIFAEGGLARKYPIGKGGKAIVRGLADKGYSATDPGKEVSQHLWAPKKKQHGTARALEDKKESQIISTVRISVQRSIGRLKQLLILQNTFRSSVQSLLDKAEYHNRIFNVCVQFTNANMRFHPMRKKPHVLLCKSDVPEKLIKRILKTFMESPKLINLGKYLTYCIRTEHDDEYVDDFEVERIS